MILSLVIFRILINFQSILLNKNSCHIFKEGIIPKILHKFQDGCMSFSHSLSFILLATLSFYKKNGNNSKINNESITGLWQFIVFNDFLN